MSLMQSPDIPFFIQVVLMKLFFLGENQESKIKNSVVFILKAFIFQNKLTLKFQTERLIVFRRKAWIIKDLH